MIRETRWILLVVLLVVGVLWGRLRNVQAAENDEMAGAFQKELLQDMDLSQVQQILDESLGEKRFSIRETMKEVLSGQEIFSKETVQKVLCSLFFGQMEHEKKGLLGLLLLMFTAAVLTNFAAVFDENQIEDACFYMVYLLLFSILMKQLGELGEGLGGQLSRIVEFMKGLAPAYFLTVTASAGAASAAAFYEGLLLLVWLLEWVMVSFLLPAVNLYILLKLVNHLSREDMLGKMAELLGMVINWTLRTLLGAVFGMQMVRSMIAPVLDALKRTAIGRTAGALPGIGNAINSVTELVVTSAVLVKNSLGVAALIALVVLGAAPVVHYGSLTLAYRLLAAVSQPISDQRLVGCLSTMGEGCSLLLRMYLYGELLCMLTLVVLMVSFGGSV